MADVTSDRTSPPDNGSDFRSALKHSVRLSSRRTQRLATILDVLAQRATLDVHELARLTGVSEATLRRDLDFLEHQELLHRTHGGASSRTAAAELPVRYRDGHQREAKQRIARACADLISRRSQALAISGGTTTTEVARLLADRRELTIVTNAINIAMELSSKPNLRIIVAGGQLRSQTSEVVGAWTERFLEGLNFNVTIMGVDGVSARGGLTTHDAVDARANRKMVDRSQKVIVVADSTKIGHLTLSQIAEVGRGQLLITDSAASPDEIAALRARGMEVVLV